MVGLISVLHLPIFIGFPPRSTNCLPQPASLRSKSMNDIHHLYASYTKYTYYIL